MLYTQRRKDLVPSFKDLTVEWEHRRVNTTLQCTNCVLKINFKIDNNSNKHLLKAKSMPGSGPSPLSA